MFSSNLLSAQNPIARAELLHLSRTETPRHVLIRAIFRGLYWAMLLLSAAFIVFTLGLALFSPDVFLTIDQQPFIWIRTPLYLLIAFSLVTHFGILSRTLSIASETVLREKRGNTWESLVLTGIDTRRLILGKWWAMVIKTWRSFMLLGFLRAGAIVGIGTLLLTNRHIQVFMLLDEPVTSAATKIIVIVIMVFVLTMANGLFTAAAGVVGSLLARHNTPGMTTAWAVRMGFALLPVVILMPLVFYLLQVADIGVEITPISTLTIALMLAQISMIDNGALTLAAAAMPLDAYGGDYLLAAMLPIVFYLLLTILLLHIGQFIARKQGASEAI